MNNSFKINFIESILILLIFQIINNIFNNLYFLIQLKNKDFFYNFYFFFYVLPYLFLYLILIFVWLPKKKETLIFKKKKPNKYILLSIIVFFFSFIMNEIIINIPSIENSRLFQYINNFFSLIFNFSLKNYLISMKLILNSTYSYLINYPFSATITIAIIAPIMEELLFRGIILQGFLNFGYKKYYALLISSCMFSIYHFNFYQMIPAFFLGTIIGWSYLISNSIILPIFLHLINNLFICLFYIIFKKTSFLPKLNSLITLLIFVLCAKIIFFFIRIYKLKE